MFIGLSFKMTNILSDGIPELTNFMLFFVCLFCLFVVCLWVLFGFCGV